MRIKAIGAFFALIIIFAVICVPAAAYASAPDGEGQATPPAIAIEPTTTEEAVTMEPEDVPEPVTPAALTPEGNLALVDDIDGEQSADKQFLTVVTKNGNYFYIVIDRAGDSENVHFLNLVDESDLLALIDGGQPEAVTAPAVTEPEPAEPAETEPAPEPENKPNISGILAAVLLLALTCGGAFFYVKVLKPKRGRSATGDIDLDEFGFEGEDDDTPYGLPDDDYTEPDIDDEDIPGPESNAGFDESTQKEFVTDDEPETEDGK